MFWHPAGGTGSVLASRGWCVPWVTLPYLVYTLHYPALSVLHLPGTPDAATVSVTGSACTSSGRDRVCSGAVPALRPGVLDGIIYFPLRTRTDNSEYKCYLSL